MRPVLLFCLMLCANLATAQKMVTTSNSDSSLVIVRDSQFDRVQERLRQDHLAHPTVPGYRVQIYFGLNRAKAVETKLDFCSKFTEVPAYLSYQQPNYKVRIGDFRNRYEAYEFLKRIERQYPTTFVVPDEVRMPSLNSEEDKKQ